MFEVWSLFTSVVMSFWARMWSSSLPARSSNISSLYPPFDGEELLLHPLWVLFSGSLYGVFWRLVYTRPVITGRSGSPPRKSTITSCPTRGRLVAP